MVGNENRVGELRALIAVPEWIEHAPRAFARSRCAVVCVRILPCRFLDGGACCLVENWTGHRITFGERHHWCIETPQLSELVIFGSQGHVYIGPAPPTPIRPIRQDDQAVWRELLNPSQETSDEINYEVGSRRSILREKSTNPQGCWSSVIGARILKRKI